MTHAIFVGASNVHPGTWPEKLSDQRGWICHNYADGGAFWSLNADSFLGQLDMAIKDTSFANADVGFVFVAGGGNDIRSGHNVTDAARTFHMRCHYAFPNARIITIPALWNDGGVHSNLTAVANQMRKGAEAYSDEIIWDAWTWLIGHPEWMADSIHPNSLGYAQFLKHINNYLDGGPVTVNYQDQYWLPAGVQNHSRGLTQCVCINGVVYFSARLVKTSGVFTRGETVMTIPAWAAASQRDNPRPLAGGLTALDRAAGFYVYSDGKVTLRTAGTGESEINIAMSSWPLGM